jgi:predicted PolB exonuclease-like 3'-5' exonuclease
MPHIIVWDLETIPDLQGFAAANNLQGKTDDEIRAELGDKFPKHIYHSIICIGALIARRDNEHWVVDALGAPHVGERSERDLIAAFVDKIAALNPQLVTFNGSSFDLPVLRTAHWCTKCLRLVYRRAPTFIGMLMTRSTCVTSCPPLRLARKRRYTSCVA